MASRFELYVRELQDRGLDVEAFDIAESDMSVGVESDIGTSDMGVGLRGADGVSVVSVTQTYTSTEQDKPNVIQILLSNGKTFDFEVWNGRDYVLTDEDKKNIADEVTPEPISETFIDDLFTEQ